MLKIALCQMLVTEHKGSNIKKAVDIIGTAADHGANLVVLPEMFNCPYHHDSFKKHAEPAGNSETLDAVTEAAAKYRVDVIAGSIPEEEGGYIYNTSYIINRSGQVIGKHRKAHLFDIDIPGKISFKESDTLSPGNTATVVDMQHCRIGVAICYDMRFPELVRSMALKGAKLIVVPAAFNTVTGPAHWELIVRSRALDNQVFFAAVSPARDINASYVAYGHSMLAGPWGDILCRADEKEQIIYADINIEEVDRVRRELPLLKHMRTDVYG